VLVIAVGMPGAGKTTVLKEVAARTGWEIVTLGDVMFSLAKEKYGIQHRDEMRAKLSKEQNESLQREAFAKVFEIAKEKNLILDTHATVKTPYGYFPGLPLDRIKGKVDLFIYITASPSEIMARRKRDAGIRKRDDEKTEEEIKAREVLNLGVLSALSVHTGAPVKVIFNKEGKVDKSVEEVVEALKWISG
jgi:adenylate kinase